MLDLQQYWAMPPEEAMNFDRLGSLHSYRLSFVRSLLRIMSQQRWRIELVEKKLDDGGYGHLVYHVTTPNDLYSFVAFSTYLKPEERTDRVIAEKWDTTFALVQGKVSDEDVARLADNVPHQEAGRVGAKELVLSRANKSVRLFDYTVDCLAKGEQPDLQKLASVGYLLRTTAVYGNGKFGLADYRCLRQSADFLAPFRAQMLVVYLARALSFDLVNHVAAARSDKAVALSTASCNVIGIGNSTGLGMAPYLIKYPALVHNWFAVRAKALSMAMASAVDNANWQRFQALVKRANGHFRGYTVPEAVQAAKNKVLQEELLAVYKHLTAMSQQPTSWQDLKPLIAKQSLETQEVMHSIIMELCPAIDDLDHELDEFVTTALDPQMTVAELRSIIEDHYGWATTVDYQQPENCHYFWYASSAKAEPRLGDRAREPGAELELPLDIARRVKNLYVALQSIENEQITVAAFLAQIPQHRGIVERVQCVTERPFGEVRGNSIAEGYLPTNLLRCKLATFGTSRFDPKSDRWLRITLFQGAPSPEDLVQGKVDDWLFPDLLSLADESL